MALDYWHWPSWRLQAFGVEVPFELLLMFAVIDLPLLVALFRLGVRHYHVPDCILRAMSIASALFRKIIDRG